MFLLLLTYLTSKVTFCSACTDKHLFCPSLFQQKLVGTETATSQPPSEVYKMPQVSSTSVALHALLHSSFSHLPTDAVSTQCTTEYPKKDLPTVEVLVGGLSLYNETEVEISYLSITFTVTCLARTLLSLSTVENRNSRGCLTGSSH